MMRIGHATGGSGPGTFVGGNVFGSTTRWAPTIGINWVKTPAVCSIGEFCINRFEPLFLERKSTGSEASELCTFQRLEMIFGWIKIAK